MSSVIRKTVQHYPALPPSPCALMTICPPLDLLLHILRDSIGVFPRISGTLKRYIDVSDLHSASASARIIDFAPQLRLLLHRQDHFTTQQNGVSVSIAGNDAARKRRKRRPGARG